MALPFADENPTNKNHKASITMALIIANVAIFIVFQNGLLSDVSSESLIGYGLIPSVFWGDKILPDQYFAIPSDYTILSYMFLHGGLMHLVSNMLILWVFGDNIEHALGKINYIIFYVMGGIAAGLLHALLLSGSDGPLVGASGAISAVGAAYLLLFPRAKIWLLVFWFIPVKIPAWVGIGAWFAYQIYESLLGQASAVAWWAHIGGFLFGIAYIMLFKKQHISPDVKKIISKFRS